MSAIADRPLDCDVAIVGSGPTGLTLALLLARAGVSVVVAEREAGLYPMPRAAHVDHQIMRVFQELGVADRISATCRHTARYDFLSAGGEVLLRFDGADRIGPGGWPASNMIHQPSLEQALREAADEARISFRHSWRCTGVEQDDAGVTTRFATAESATTLRSRFLVGADGANSAVRGAAAIELHDLGFDEPWLVIDAIVTDPARLPSINLQICDPERPTTCVLMGAGRHRWEFMIKPGETPEQLLDDAVVAELLAPWKVEGAIEIERKAVYRFAAKVAREWRRRRVLLAGDAAHQMPPFAGQGLCSGVRDAANLAWKLGAVRHGAPISLLDTYQVEREPNVRAIIGMAMMMGRMVCVTDPVAAAARDAQLLTARAAGSAGPGGAVGYPDLTSGCILAGSKGAGDYFPQATHGGARLDTVLGAGAWLIARTPEALGVPTGVTGVALDNPALVPFADALARWLDDHEAAAVLVRPDRYVFGTGTAAALAEGFRASVHPHEIRPEV